MSILNRTVYYDYSCGVVRFWDWANVTTTIGAMAEPFQPGSRYEFAPQREFDPTDEIAMINEIHAKPIDLHMLYLSGGNNQLNGGTQMPRLGK